jgi:hypothetical protein
MSSGLLFRSAFSSFFICRATIRAKLYFTTQHSAFGNQQSEEARFALILIIFFEMLSPNF